MKITSATRRELLRIGAAFGGVAAAASPFAMQLATMGSVAAQTAPDYRALVCIFLFGGNDTHNMVLATDDDSWSRYWLARNTGQDPIALMPVGTASTPLGQTSTLTGRVSARNRPEFWGGVLPIVPNTPNPVPAGTTAAARTFGIHPLMADLLPVWTAQRLAIVSNVGPLIQPTTKAQYNARSVRLPANLMSHNDQQSTWQAGAAEGARRGWGGLMADQLLSANGANSVFTAISAAGNAVFLAGRDVVQYQVSTGSLTPAVRINSAAGTSVFGNSSNVARLREVIRDTSNSSLFMRDHANRVVRSMDTADSLNAAFTQTAVTGIPAPPAYTNPISGNVEANALATQLQQVARLIATNTALGMRRQVFFVSMGGWDTHDIQNQTQSNLLARVAHAMAYFDGVLGNIGGADYRNAVTTFTASDFSRTFTTNGDGTDHAWGSHQFVMGGAVQGRNIYGQYPTLGVDRTGFNNPDMSGNIQIPTTSVDQFAGTMGRWFGLSDANLNFIFPNLVNFTPRYLGFL
jgi:uncharacterized protein (DUF1501 family)